VSVTIRTIWPLGAAGSGHAREGRGWRSGGPIVLLLSEAGVPLESICKVTVYLTDIALPRGDVSHCRQLADGRVLRVLQASRGRFGTSGMAGRDRYDRGTALIFA